MLRSKQSLLLLLSMEGFKQPSDQMPGPRLSCSVFAAKCDHQGPIHPMLTCHHVAVLLVFLFAASTVACVGSVQAVFPWQYQYSCLESFNLGFFHCIKILFASVIWSSENTQDY